MPKTHYQYSGKINLIPFIITTVIALAACIWCGRFYGKNTDPDLELSSRIFAMVFWTAILLPIFYLFRRFNQSRNPGMNVKIGILLSFSSWFTCWVFYRDMEMKGIHLVELVMVALPISILPIMRYYCEECRQYYYKSTAYILDADKFYNKAKQTSNYNFLPDMELDNLPDKGPVKPKEIIRVNVYHCLACGTRSIVDIDSYTLSRKSEHSYFRREGIIEHLSHDDSSISKGKSIAHGVFLNEETGRKLKQYLVG